MKTPELSTEHLLQWREASVQWSDPSATQQLPRLNEDRVFTYDPEKLSFSEDPVQHDLDITPSFPPWVKVPTAPPRNIGLSREERYILLKKFEGVVMALTDESFTARLKENFQDYPTIDAEFSFEELSESDR